MHTVTRLPKAFGNNLEFNNALIDRCYRLIKRTLKFVLYMKKTKDKNKCFLLITIVKRYKVNFLQISYLSFYISQKKTILK